MSKYPEKYYGDKPHFVKCQRAAILRQMQDDMIAGLNREKLIEKYGPIVGGAESRVKAYVQEAYNNLMLPEEKEKARALNSARLEELYKQCFEKKDIKNALKAIDILNKTLGIYDQPTTTVNVNTDEGKNFSLSFGNGLIIDSIDPKKQPDIQEAETVDDDENE